MKPPIKRNSRIIPKGFLIYYAFALKMLGGHTTGIWLCYPVVVIAGLGVTR